MALGIAIFLLMGLAMWGSYKALERGADLLNRRAAERERRSFVEVAQRELLVEPISVRGRPSEDLLLAARVEDTVVRVTRQLRVVDFGTEPVWLIDIEDPALEAPREELPRMIEVLRKTAVLPDEFKLEPGKLHYTELAKSVPQAVERIRALLALLAPTEPAAPL